MATIKEYAKLSDEVYKDGGGNPGGDWKMFALSREFSIGTETGYYGVAYRNTSTNEIVIAHRGTEPTELNDLSNDLQLVLGKVPSQVVDAGEFYDKVLLRAKNITNVTYTHTGHSLGGAISRYLSAEKAQSAYIFNAPGIAGTPTGDYSRVHAYNAVYDPVSSFGTQVGQVKNYFVSSYYGVPDIIEPLAILLAFKYGLGFAVAAHFADSQHSIKNLREVLEALPDGEAGADKSVAGLAISTDYKVTGSGTDEWSGLESELDGGLNKQPKWDGYGGDLTAEEIRAEQNSDQSTALQDQYDSQGLLVAGLNGADQLTGGDGADYMYGDSGSDDLTGGGSGDILVGGAGEDTLKGEAGADMLVGGDGSDTYVYNSGDGTDTILDSDGQGTIKYDGTALSGGKKLADNVWQSDDKKFLYTLHTETDGKKTLSISGPGGTLVVKDFTSGDLGISLGDLENIDYNSIAGTGDSDNLGVEVEKDVSSILHGTAGNDMVRDSSKADQLYGDEENDILIATGGNDQLYGGVGNDALQGGADSDSLEGNEGDDLLDGGAGSDALYGGDGADFLFGGGSFTPNVIFEQLSDPNAPEWGVVNGNSTPTLAGIGGYSDIEGDEADLLDGGAGNDFIDGGEGGDYADGGSGDDIITGLVGDDALLGGAGDDTLYGDGAKGEITFSGPTVVGDGSLYTLPENHGNDYLDGAEGSDKLIGDGGDDELLGGAGDDTLVGDSSLLDSQYHGDDYLDGEDGADQLFGNGGNDVLFGGADNDTLEGDSNDVAAAQQGDDYLDGEDGDDILVGDGGADALFGGAGADQLYGDADDVPSANQGNDTLDGEEGDDYLRGYGGDDALFGGAGSDQMLGEDGNDTLDGGEGNDQGDGGNGNDVLLGSGGDDMLFAGAGDDVLDGGDGNDALVGEGGNDALNGGAGADQLFGGMGNDVLAGGGGDDVLVGDNGDLGPGGSDTYEYNAGGGTDHIVDSNEDGQINTLRFGSGIDATQIRLRLGSLKIDLGYGNEIHIDNFDQNDVVGSSTIQRFEFADGAVFTTEELVARGFDLDGTDGDDAISGTNVTDRITGGTGNDQLTGGRGDDTYIYNLDDGSDTINDESQWVKADCSVVTDTNTLRFGAGITGDSVSLRHDEVSGRVLLDFANGDSLDIGTPASLAVQAVQYADGSVQMMDEFVALHGGLGAGADDIEGTPGVDFLAGTPAANRIRGYAGDDVLRGNDGNDTLEGGTGNDKLIGGKDDDTYVYNFGDGADTITDNGGWYWDSDLNDAVYRGSNTLSFGTGITPDSITPLFDTASRNVTLDLGNGDSIDIGSVDDIAIQTLKFTDGTALTMEAFLALKPLEVAGSDAAETLYGTPFADRIRGKAGDDLILGGEGGDAYFYELGDGADTLVDSGPGNTLVFGAGITQEMVAPRRTQDGLCVLDLGGGDSVVVGSLPDMIIHGNYEINPFDGFAVKTLQFADGITVGVEDFVMGRGLTLSGTELGETLVGEDGRGGVIPDRLEGNRGNDTLIGGGGSDTYVFNRGDGADTIKDGASWQTHPEWGGMPGGDNTLVFGAGITADLITARFQRGYARGIPDAITLDLGNGDSVNIGSSSYDLAVQNLRFADGSTVSVQDFLMQRGIWQTGTSWGDYLEGPANFPRRVQGLAGDDVVYGGMQGDILEGGAGQDVLTGGDGSDVFVYNRGDGADTINDDYLGANILRFGAGIAADAITPSWNEVSKRLRLDLGNGDSLIIGSLENLAVKTLQFSDGTELALREFLAQKGTIQAAGTADGDLMATFADGLPLRGQGGDDRLYGSVLGDTLEGGSGDDILVGGVGNDVYVYNLGDGADSIIERMDDDVDTLRFGTGISADMITPVFDAVTHSLMLDLGNGDSISIGTDFEPAVQNLQFADGSTLSLNDFMNQRGELLQSGTDGDDFINGTPYSDRLEGWAGNDTLYAKDSDDVLIGGEGDDFLAGEFGNDTYVFNPGDGTDTIEDSAYGQDQYEGEPLNEVNTLILGGSITPAMATPSVDEEGRVFIDLGNGDRVNIGWQDNLAIQKIQFSDGSVLFPGLVLNDAPPVANPIADQVARQGDAFSFAVPADAFVDPDVGDSLSYGAKLANGGLLPAWLNFDPITRTFSGTPDNWDVADLEVSVSATDSQGLAAESSFILAVLNVNDAPTTVTPLPDQVAETGKAFNFGIAGGAAEGFLSDVTDGGTLDNVDMAYDSYVGGDVGNDAFSFGRGDGKVYLSDWDETPGNMDTVQFSQDVSPADIAVTQDQWGNVTLSIAGAADSLTLGSWLYSEAYRIERLVFADGTAWGVDEMMSRVSTAASGSDNYIAGSGGDDAIRALQGNDGVFGGAGDDALLGGAGNDFLEGGGGSDILGGGSGMDSLIADNAYADLGNDLLSGGAGDDGLEASIANDLLIGGSGNDTIYGDDGNDVLLFNRGDGNDLYGSDASTNGVPLAERTDTVSLGGGISYADLAFERGGDDLILHVGNGESITFASWFNTDWQDNKAIATLQIVAEKMAGYDARSDDPLFNKRIQQFDFAGLARRFDEVLAGEPESTTWALAPHLGEFHLGGSDDQAIGGDMAYLYGVEGNLNRLGEAEARGQLNDASFGVAAQTLTMAGTAAAAEAFADIDAIHGDTLTYRATLADGSPLPSWLSFDAATGTFSGMPARSDVGVWNVSVIATDAGGLSATADFALRVSVAPGANSAPELSAPLPDRLTLEDQEFVFAIPADAFRDADADQGDTLTYGATLADGSPLPSWLSFDAAAGTFSGTPGNGDVGSMYVTVTATDSGGLAASASFMLDVANVNDAPVSVVGWSEQQVLEDQPFSFVVPADAFSDDDFIHGDSLTYGATLEDGGALPSWLGFDAATGTLGGTPANEDVGDLKVAISATDKDGLAASAVLTLSVVNVNDAPHAADDRVAVEEDGGTAILSAAALLSNDSDPDRGDSLNIVAVSQAESGAAVSLAGEDVRYEVDGRHQSLGAGQSAADVFSYTVADAAGLTSTATVAVEIVGANDAPELARPLDSRNTVAGQDFSLSLPVDTFVDVDSGDTLTYAAILDDGTPLPSWLGFDPATLTFSGNPTGASSYQIRVTASDSAGAVASGSFTLDVAAANAVPVAADDAASVMEDSQTVAIGNVLTNDRDMDAGTTLRVADAGDRQGDFGILHLAEDGSYSYMLDNASAQSLGADQSRVERFGYRASDGVLAASGELAITVMGKNDIPVLAVPLADIKVAANSDFTWQVPEGSFTDVDQGDVLTEAAQLANGCPLPTWLEFDAATRTFSGHVPGNAKDFLDIKVTAGDGHGAVSTASDVFRMTFEGGSYGGHGNEGVGNGKDGPPPGHDDDHNDGEGTYPGYPGSRGGKRDDDDHHDTGRSKGSKGKSSDDDHDGKQDGNDRDKLCNVSYLDPKKLDKYSGDSGRTSREADSGANVARWIEVDLAVSRQMTMGEDSRRWECDSLGADTMALHASSSGLFGSNAGCGVDMISLSTGTGTHLKGFRGLQEGIRQIA